MSKISLVAIALGFSTATALAEDPANHWSFQPIKRPAPPIADVSPIDAFIRHALAEKNLTPSPEADRRTLCRRLYFDLTGLPPSPEEIEAFVNDPDPKSYENLVDKLLASPRFGEHWASPWLDAVRFAESDGFETNVPRANAWPYRDYVIRACNEDIPFDRFAMEQLAGDVTGTDEATGFLVGGPVDVVGSPDPVLTSQQRADVLHDMINTTGSAFLGLTIGCARCHDHKFDPVPQTEYYAMKAVFEGVTHGSRPKRLPVSSESTRETERKKVEAELAAAWIKADTDAPLTTSTSPRPAVNPRRNVERFAPVTAKFVRFNITSTNSAEPCIDELEVYAAGSGDNVALGAKPTSSGNFGGFPHDLAYVNDGRLGNSRSWISNTAGRGWVMLEFPEPRRIDRIVWGRDRLGQYADRLATAYQIEAALEPDAWQIVASSGNRQTFGPDAKPPPAPPGAEALEQRLKELSGSGPMVYAGNFAATPVTTKLFRRGDAMQPQQAVLPAGLHAVPVLFTREQNYLTQEAARICGMPAPQALTEDQNRRLALARWIGDPKNPLTPRVVVNRIWQGHFGEGIVNTPGDFGVKGAAPVNQALLDWMAAEFLANGWRSKPLHRLILTSATYRQSSAPRADALKVDAGSRLLWRFPPRRLDAESIRDAILFASGVLDLTMGGPGFSGFEDNSNYVRVYNPKKTFGPNDWRRAIYMTKIRMRTDGTFGAFDCPDAGQVAPKRSRSTTPLQALNLLNSPFMEQQASLMADRVKKDAGSKAEDQITLAFRLVFGRAPSAEETGGALSLTNSHGLPALTRALLNANEFLFLF
ncbi:MAG TPA: DUF1553 domain-containing protein [Verrucomicrobiales bacterium]|jgi:hypothetical protein|nr:DUF1553 domain-containing protein [Verrucomicrobiales bacterium]